MVALSTPAGVVPSSAGAQSSQIDLTAGADPAAAPPPGGTFDDILKKLTDLLAGCLLAAPPAPPPPVQPGAGPASTNAPSSVAPSVPTAPQTSPNAPTGGVEPATALPAVSPAADSGQTCVVATAGERSIPEPIPVAPTKVEPNHPDLPSGVAPPPDGAGEPGLAPVIERTADASRTIPGALAPRPNFEAATPARGNAVPRAAVLPSVAPEKPENKEQDTRSAPDASWAQLSLSSHAALGSREVHADRGPSVQTQSSPADQIKEAIHAARDEAQRSGRTEVRLRLDPPELGQVRLHLSGDQHRVSARLVVEEKGTAALLQNQADGMRQRLQEVGITLAKFEVAWQGAGQSGQWQAPGQGPPAPELFGPAPGRNAGPMRRSTGAQPRGQIDILA